MNAPAADEATGSPPPHDRSGLPFEPDQPKTVGEAIADQVDELLRSIRSD